MTGSLVDMAGGGAIDFGALHRKITTIYLILPTGELNDQAKWLRIFVNLALRNLYESAPTDDKPPTLPPVLFMLDEFGNLGRLQEIVKALNMARSARVQLMFFLQNLGQLTGLLQSRAWQLLFRRGRGGHLQDRRSRHRNGGTSRQSVRQAGNDHPDGNAKRRFAQAGSNPFDPRRRYFAARSWHDDQPDRALPVADQGACAGLCQNANLTRVLILTRTYFG